jgi:hypothetical protein
LPGLMSLTRIECLRWDGNGDRTGGSCFGGRRRDPSERRAPPTAAAGGQGVAATYAQWTAAISHNGLGDYAGAFAAARQASEHSHLYVSLWALPELIEAAVRTGDRQTAAGALERLAVRTQAGGTDFGLGLEARCRALSDGPSADGLYREGRRLDARDQLRIAYGLLTAIGMAGFAERARRELTATGEVVRRRSVETITTLTAQEDLIAGLARDGRSNPEIGAQLYLSAWTVEWHLRKGGIAGLPAGEIRRGW